MNPLIKQQQQQPARSIVRHKTIKQKMPFFNLAEDVQNPKYNT